MRPTLCTILLLVGACESPPISEPHPDVQWSNVTGDVGGSRFTPSTAIDSGNVAQLRVVWMRRLGDSINADGCGRCAHALPRFEATPITVGGLVVSPTPLGNIVAFDAGTGADVWRYDSRVDVSRRYPEGLTTRGLALWTDVAADTSASCRDVVIHATVDAKLHAVAARSGVPCSGFGAGGVVDLGQLLQLHSSSQPPTTPAHSVTSPALVVDDIVVVGMTSRDNSAASGTVAALDARTGRLLWRFHTAGSSPTDSDESRGGSAGGNVWSLMSADTGLGLVYLPVGGPRFNHFGGGRPGDNRFANAVIALSARSGELAWAFQLIRHDLWDYDVGTQPVLLEVPENGSRVDAVLGISKSGEPFLLNRRTGDALGPREDRIVPKSDVAGEVPSRTQPRGWKGLSIESEQLTEDNLFGRNPGELLECQRKFREARYDGMFTPPSRRGSIVWPGVWGGPNWDGAGWDAGRQLLIIPVRRIASIVRVLTFEEAHSLGRSSVAEQRFFDPRTRTVVVREPFAASSGVPCTKPPWAELVAVDIGHGRIAWRTPMGVESRTGGGFAFGGPLLTASGLIFIAATQDDKIRAFATSDGRVLWQHQLPAGGQSAPMSYTHGGRQFITILAGGRGGIGTPGDWIVAFAVPKR